MALDGDLDVTPAADAVEFVLTVSNPDPDPVELRFRSSLAVDFAVLDGEREVWRYSDGRAFAQQLRTDRLEPGESPLASATWRACAPGEYRVRATLRAENQPLEWEASFSV
ncbi:MAG: BsuPI-related putative proteinase inhibitor [Haloferacaceae archaeon]